MRFRISPKSISSVSRKFTHILRKNGQNVLYLNLKGFFFTHSSQNTSIPFCANNKCKNDFWLKNNTNEGQSELASVNGKSTASNKVLSVHFPFIYSLTKTLIRNVLKRAHNAKVNAKANVNRSTHGKPSTV